METREEIMRKVLAYLQCTDYNQSNPEVMKCTWDIITKEISNKNPYADIKVFYNKKIENISLEIKDLIDDSTDPLKMALKVAIGGNLIDLASSHDFDENSVKEFLLNLGSMELGKDESNELIKSLSNASTLLYLGDNCGEIVLDKLFIKYIKEFFPSLQVVYGVRGKPIINDVTLDDAEMINMNEVASVVSNGDGSLGTVIEKVTDEFKKYLYNSDVIIAKGQGNFESLSEFERDNLYFMFMAKCDVVAKAIGVKKMEIVCAKR